MVHVMLRAHVNVRDALLTKIEVLANKAPMTNSVNRLLAPITHDTPVLLTLSPCTSRIEAHVATSGGNGIEGMMDVVLVAAER